MRRLFQIFFLICVGSVSSQTMAQPIAPQPMPAARVIVKFKEDGNFLRRSAGLDRATSLSQRVGRKLALVHNISSSHQVLSASGLSSEQLAAKLSELDEVEFAEPDYLRKINGLTNDPMFPRQWYLQNKEVSASNFSAAWELGTGAGQTVVAVLDTGITDHPDLQNKLVPGYNFISDPVLAMNGVGRSANPSDPGDYIDASVRNDPAFVRVCSEEELAYDAASSWHGTRVAGLIAAQTDNALGMAGAGRQLKILPIRVLGKCGGFDSDIQAAMLWAAGLSVPGVPNNPNPARVINLSLGGSSPCTRSYAIVLSQLASQAVVVAAAGNEGGAVGSPANCPGVLAVAGLRNQGDKVGYSSWGKEVAISAPAGNCVNTEAGQPCLFPMHTITNSGQKGPFAPSLSDEFNYSVGTSFSAPLVSAAVGLMVDLNPALTPEETKAKVKVAVRPFVQLPERPLCENTNEPIACNCTSVYCGSGMLDAFLALRLASPQALAIPESGWWWSPEESGSAYSIEIQGNRLFMAAFAYTPEGRSVWGVAAGKLSTDGRFSGDITEYVGGQSLNGPYRPAQVKGNVTPLQLECETSQNCTMSLSGRRVDMTRFRYGATLEPGKAPETGWWWNPAENGRGYFLEAQGNTLFLASYMYDTVGNAVWYIASGTAAEFKLGTAWVEYANGQTFTGAYQAAQVKNNAVGSVKLVFSSTQKAVLTLPDGRLVPLQRFEF